MRALAPVGNPDFTDPGTAWDWFAVASFSAALLALAAALPSLARLAGGRAAFAISLLPALGAALAGAGNLAEDGAGLAWAGDWLYLPGAALLGPGLAGFTVALAVGSRGGRRLFAAVPAATVLGLVLFELGGGVLVLAAWVALALVSPKPEEGLEPSA